MSLTLITNRTGGEKYDFEDLNRVETAILYIKNMLNDAGISANIIIHGTWSNGDNPTLSDMDNYLNSLRKIRASIAFFRNSPDVPSDMDNLRFFEANNIEKVLIDAEQLIYNMIFAYRHCGTLSCGQEGLII